MGKLVNEFSEYRERMNERILDGNNKVIKRIFDTSYTKSAGVLGRNGS